MQVLRDDRGEQTAGMRFAHLNVFLGIVPSATSVGHGNSHLDPRHKSACQETSQGAGAEEDSDNNRAEHDEGTGWNHLR